jgi:GNAT superfamily N-acetyltransferase
MSHLHYHDEIELLAELDGKVVGCAGINCVGRKEKIRHRAEFGISVDKAYWGLGIGRALTEACIECAKKAGYVQLELEVVAENKSALAVLVLIGAVFSHFGGFGTGGGECRSGGICRIFRTDFGDNDS